MSYFVDTNQQKVCTRCGHRWNSYSVDSGCQKCGAERKLGGQILPEPEAEPVKASKGKKDED